MQHLIPLEHGQFRFLPVDRLGAGGFGAVERIRITESNIGHMPVGSEWAQKHLNEKWRQEPEALARFNREIVSLRRMNHPNVMKVMGENLTSGAERFYIMPLYPFTLRGLISKNWSLGDWRSVARFGARLASALQHAHLSGFFHRDIKPENIMLDQQGTPVLADWGLGYFVHKHSVVLHDLTLGGMGTEYYCSLEQWNTGKCDGRGDIYSLGMTLDELVRSQKRALRHCGAGLDGDSVAPVTQGAVYFNSCLRMMTDAIVTRRFASMQQVELQLNHAAALS